MNGKRAQIQERASTDKLAREIGEVCFEYKIYFSTLEFQQLSCKLQVILIAWGLWTTWADKRY